MTDRPRCIDVKGNGDKCRVRVAKVGLRCRDHQDGRPKCGAPKPNNKGPCKTTVINIGDRCWRHPKKEREHLHCGILTDKRIPCKVIVYVLGNHCYMHKSQDERNAISKVCRDCKISKPFKDFSKEKAGSYGVTQRCKQCTKNISYSRRKIGTKRCTRCLEIKHVILFSSYKFSKDGLRGSCKLCSNTLLAELNSNLSSFVKSIFKTIKANCKKGNYICDINPDIIIDIYNAQNGICSRTGKKMTYTQIYDPDKKSKLYEDRYYNLSVDRIDSLKGYTKDNIQLVCSGYNLMKWNMDDSVMLEYLQKIVEYSENHIKQERLVDVDDITKSFIRNIYRMACINTAKSRTKNTKVLITIDDFIELYQQSGGICSLTRIGLTSCTMRKRIGFYSMTRKERGPIKQKKTYNNISFDRIDSSGDYDNSNIQVICSIVNMMKAEMSMNIFLDFCKSTVNHASVK
uniref:Zn-finger protein n=1 Tax=Pithovirus LCPAC406 TaxID=2506599 RepID=A0A481ZF07_9VIRU|nr:MAG: uncharacterized protein LCPAC406_00960 [Pithovirus LCPAC406]